MDGKNKNTGPLDTFSFCKAISCFFLVVLHFFCVCVFVCVASHFMSFSGRRLSPLSISGGFVMSVFTQVRTVTVAGWQEHVWWPKF